MAIDKTVFIDSCCFCGLNNSKDTLHIKSKLAFSSLRKEEHKLFTSNFIISETITVLSQRAGKKAASKFGEDIFNQDNLIEILRTNISDEINSFNIFKKVKSKNISFVDVSTLALMKKYKINYLLTFDKKLIIEAKKYKIKSLTY